MAPRRSRAPGGAARENLGALVRRLFGPEHGADLDLPYRGNTMGHSPPDFSGLEYDPP